MTRVPHPARGKVPPVVATDAADAAPIIPATQPLPSDQTASGKAPAAPVAVAEPLAGVETAPLPVPERAPGERVGQGASKPPLKHVDGTIPLPSDQLTPLVSTRGDTDVSATTRSAIAGAADDERAIDREVLGEDHGVSTGLAGIIHNEDRSAERRSEARAADRPAPIPEPSTDSGTLFSQADVESVFASEHRTELVRAFRDMASLAIRMADYLEGPATDPTELRGDIVPEERRSFRVVSDVHHDGNHIEPGGRVTATRAHFEQLRRGGAIPARAEWDDGEDG